MTLLGFSVVLLLICVAAGLVGSLVGIGGGIIVVPVLTLYFHVPIRLAIGASIVSVIATSSGAASTLLREHIANLRVGMFLEIATTTGAVTGAFIAGVVSTRVLYVVFGSVLVYSAVQMFRHRHGRAGLDAPPDRIADALALHDEYYDEAEARARPYRVTHAPQGLALMYVAGGVSGLLGIGSGALKVPALDLEMRLPIKVSTATSNFMIGVTAAASAGVYFARGDVQPMLAAPVAAGVLVGAIIGARLLPHLHRQAVRGLFLVLLVVIAVQMLVKGFS